MIVLNLLPESSRSANQRRELLAMIVVSLWLLSAAALLACAAIVGTRVFLAAQLNHVLGLQITDQAPSPSDAQALEFKTLAAALERIEGERRTWSATLKTVLAAAQPEITLAQVALDGTGGSITASGQARTRQALLDFEAALRTALPGATTQLPPGSLVEPTDIVFTLTVKLPAASATPNP